MMWLVVVAVCVMGFIVGRLYERYRVEKSLDRLFPSGWVLHASEGTRHDWSPSAG